MDEIYSGLNRLIQEQKMDQVEGYLTSCMEKAQEEEAHGVYLAAGNELLTFYRETQQYEKSFPLAENLLLLMEEFQLEGSLHFALLLINTASSYADAGRLNEGLSFYARAVQILKGLHGQEERPFLLAEALVRQALLFQSLQEMSQGEKLLREALAIYEADNQEGEEEPEPQRRNLFYLTALTGLGEASYRRGDREEALKFYERAACESEKNSPLREGSNLLWNNCLLLARELGDPEREAFAASHIHSYCSLVNQ